MKGSRPFSWLLAATLAAGCLGVAVRPSPAIEQTHAFLEGLRDRGFYDVALDYLEQMRTSPLADKKFKDVIDYEAGVTLILGSQTVPMSVRGKQLDQAHARLKAFVENSPKHPLANAATTQMANVLVERGKLQVEMTSRAKTPDEKKAMLAAALELYQEAQKVLESAEQRFMDALKKYPKLLKDDKLTEERDAYRRDLLAVRLALATVVYESAQTHEPGSEDYKKLLTDAAKRYNELFSKYGQRLAGLYARMYEARCYKELDDSAKAMAALEELLGQPDEPEPFRVMKTKALILHQESAIKFKKFKEGVARYLEWEKAARGPDETSPDGLAIKCLTAELRLAATKLLKDDAESQKIKREFLTEARKLAAFVSRFPSDYKSRAMRVLEETGGASGGTEGEPKDYAGARERARMALDRMGQLSESKEDQEKNAKQIAETRDEAMKYFRMALALRPPETKVEEVNVIRYYLAYLYWASDSPYEAAVLGEFLARRYPNSAAARQAARIALGSYAKLFNEIPATEDRTFEAERMNSIAEFMAKRWAGEAEADEAAMTLVRTAVLERKPEKAVEYLKLIPEGSPRRGEAELTAGQSLWSAYLQAAKLPDDQRPAQAELDKMIQQAQKILEDGISRMQKVAGSDPSYTLAVAVLSLAQIYVGTGQADKAVKWLEDEKLGPLTLITANHASTERASFRTESYKAALRAYVAVQQLDRAEKAMNALEELITKSGDAEASKRLTQIYIQLGRELQDQLERLRHEKKTEQLKAVSEGFELFLTKIADRQAGNTFNSLNWVAETFNGMGAGFDPGGLKLTPEAEKYYKKAAATYRTMLDRMASDKTFAPSEGADDSIKIRLARCERRLGLFKESLELLLGILKERQMMVDAQVEAAYTYQAWGEEKPVNYSLAISGSQRYKELWGWGQTARRLATSTSPKHQDLFHECRYNLALCRFKLAQTKSGTEERNKYLDQAIRDITIVQMLFPTMGGPEWWPKYDDLLKKIQKLRGFRADGLKGTAGKVAEEAAKRKAPAKPASSASPAAAQPTTSK